MKHPSLRELTPVLLRLGLLAHPCVSNVLPALHTRSDALPRRSLML
jgi:hypothetical protein